MMSPPWIILGWAALILIVIAVMTAAIVATLMVRSRNRHWREFQQDRHRMREEMRNHLRRDPARRFRP